MSKSWAITWPNQDPLVLAWTPVVSGPLGSIWSQVPRRHSLHVKSEALQNPQLGRIWSSNEALKIQTAEQFWFHPMMRRHRAWTCMHAWLANTRLLVQTSGVVFHSCKHSWMRSRFVCEIEFTRAWLYPLMGLPPPFGFLPPNTRCEGPTRGTATITQIGLGKIPVNERLMVWAAPSPTIR